MARPKRLPGERAAVAAAFAEMVPGLSDRSRARNLAERVVRELIAASCRTDPMEIALAAAVRVTAADPAVVLAHDPEIDLAAELRRERMAKFEARGCSQLGPAAWDAETIELAQVLVERFAERFRRC